MLMAARSASRLLRSRAPLQAAGARQNLTTAPAWPVLQQLLTVAQWRLAAQSTPALLEKRFRFDSAAVAARFVAQCEDLRAKVEARAASRAGAGSAAMAVGAVVPEAAEAGGGAGGSGGAGAAPARSLCAVVVTVSAPAGAGGAVPGSLREEDAAAVASAVDDIGAQLQLQGRWG
jgi:hypothetical protein